MEWNEEWGQKIGLLSQKCSNRTQKLSRSWTTAKKTRQLGKEAHHSLIMGTTIVRGLHHGLTVVVSETPKLCIPCFATEPEKLTQESIVLHNKFMPILDYLWLVQANGSWLPTASLLIYECNRVLLIRICKISIINSKVEHKVQKGHKINKMHANPKKQKGNLLKILCKLGTCHPRRMWSSINNLTTLISY